MSDPSATTAPTKVKRIHWRSGIRRIFYALSVLYFVCWAMAAFNWADDNPFFIDQPPAPSEAPIRALLPLESQNPRVQQLMSLVVAREGDGIAYNRELLGRWVRDQERRYVRDVPQWQADLINETTRRYSAEGIRYVVLPAPNGTFVAYPATMTLTELKLALEEAYARWRWRVHFDYSGACLNGVLGCYTSASNSPFAVDPAIHCQAKLDRSSYLGQRRLNELLPTSCGQLGQELYEEALTLQQSSRTAFWTAAAFMIGIWLAVFAFGKVFWWIIDGFSGKRSRFDPATST